MTLRRLRIALLALLVIGLLSGVASAQLVSGTDTAALVARKNALFQQMLGNPSNLDIAFAYADVSAKLGDNEAAVSALERMLLFNPNLPRVQLELGALYFRMGSYQIAKTYFDKAMAANPPPEVKKRIQTYLAQIDRLSSPQRFSGYLFLGGQYQSDANLAPGSPLVHSPIGDVLLNSQFVKMADKNVFITSSVLYSYDFGDQAGDALEVGGTGYANHYSSVTRLDLGVVEATIGPRFQFRNPMPNVIASSLKPYFIVNDVSLGGNQYFHTLGAGAEATATVFGDVRLKSSFEYRRKDFDNAPDRPLSTGLNGSDKLFSLFLTKPITAVPQSELTLEFDFLAQDTAFGFFTNKTYAGSAAYHIRYDDPTHILKFPWDTTAFVSRSSANYAAPDPCCNTSGNPFIFIPGIRSDQHWRFGVSQSFQVSDNIAFVVQVQRDIISSTLPIYAFTSNSILFGPQIRF